MEKTPEETFRKLQATRERQLEQSREGLLPKTLGSHVLALMERGEVLTVENLQAALTKTADTGDSSQRDLARYALERIHELPGSS